MQYKLLLVGKSKCVFNSHTILLALIVIFFSRLPDCPASDFIIVQTQRVVQANVNANALSGLLGNDVNADGAPASANSLATAATGSQITLGNDAIESIGLSEATISADEQPILQALTTYTMLGSCEAHWDFDWIGAGVNTFASALATGVVQQQVGSGNTVDAVVELRLNCAAFIDTAQLYVQNTGDGLPGVNSVANVGGVPIVTVLSDGTGGLVVSVFDPVADTVSINTHAVVGGIVSLDIPITVTDGQAVTVTSNITFGIGGDGFTPTSDAFEASGTLSMAIKIIP